MIAQTDELCRKSTEGTDFWFGFMESRNYNENHYLEITVTARETSTFKITVGPNETPFGGTYTVNSNRSAQVLIPWRLVEALGSETIEGKGIHIISEKPVNLYALNWDQNSADVAVIYPIESLGNEYFAMCYYPNIALSNPTSGDGRNSEFMVVAVEDNTQIKITPSKVTDKLQPKDSTFIIMLNKGEVYQVQSENDVGSDEYGQGDLTGSHILADKPVAFYSGSLSTTIPTGQCCWDHLYEQIPPVHSWGREYYTVPLKSRQQDRYRIIAAENNTAIQITDRPTFYLDRGEFSEVVFFYDDPKRIFSNKPIMVAQFSQSRDVDESFTGGDGDPFMIILSSVTQSKNDVTFVAYDSDNIKKYFVNIISLTSEINNIRFNGSSISDEFQPFTEGEYSFAQKAISRGTHHIENINEDQGFLAYVYGFGGWESYGYGVGFNLDLVLDLGESIDFDGDTLLLCYGNSIELDAGPYFDTYDWNTGAKTQKITVTKAGEYSVKTTTNEGCKLQDSIYVYVSKPVVDLGIDYDEGCFPHTIELNGNDGFEKYIWQNQYNDTLSTDQIIIADQTNEYRITVYNDLNCAARDTMNLVVFPAPLINIEGEAIVCGTKTSKLSVIITDAPDSVWNDQGSFTWSANNPELQFIDETHQNSKIEVTNWGDYEIYYRLKTIDNCIIKDTFHLRFHPQPISDFTFEEDSKCEGYSKKLIFNGAATDSAYFYWDLDGCQFVDTLGWQSYNVTVGAFLNKQPYIKLVIDDNGCWSDTITRPIGAKPNFTMEADNLRGCDELTVNFTSELLTDDNVDFVWTFGDGETVESQDVTKHYPGSGFYDVTLTITNPVTQCQNGFTIDSMIKVFPTPTAAITADPSFCYTDSANVSYTHNIDSSFCTWNFEGAHYSGIGNDSIAVIFDEPFGKVILTVDEYGCISQPVEITLKRKPQFDFYTENEEGCQPNLLDIFTEPLDNFLNFAWLTDSVPFPSDISHSYTFPRSGKYDIGLISTSNETGCLDTLIKTDWIWVHPKPIAAFDVNFSVALIEHADITYTNLSQHAINYNWDFGDNETSIELSPVHTFTELGEYNTQLFAASEFGCFDTSELLITILPFTVHTPNAFRPNSRIPENQTFMPVGIGVDISRFYLKIYDRLGQLVFESNSPENPWDGTKKGNDSPMGNYVWISHFFDIQGFEHNQKGQVLLIR